MRKSSLKPVFGSMVLLLVILVILTVVIR
ncbi:MULTISPECIES: magnesium transporter protection protein MgtU [Pantoea]